MSVPATHNQFTFPCCSRQVHLPALPIESDPELQVRYDSMAEIMDSVCLLPAVKELLWDIEASPTPHRSQRILRSFLVSQFVH